ncbi:hypothetical protein J4733_06525 [Klebsiella pneumoniae]|uniref:5'-nucleotidase n=1 Tax=Klebsiella pneumoniae TaxID=573 RepID=A0A939NR95_KLEPN|nr:hypothetical protein [Klebsiella pneumoniae]
MLSNDDGIHAPGIQTTAKALGSLPRSVVAPDRNRSGASNSLTLESSLRTFTFENGDIAVRWAPHRLCLSRRERADAPASGHRGFRH